MISFLIFLIVLIVLITVLKGQFKENLQVEKILNTLRVAVGVGILLAILFASIIQIGPGEAGVQILFGNVQDKVLRSGLNFINPLIEVQKLDIKTQAYTMSGVNDQDDSEIRVKKSDPIQTLSSDGLTLILDVTVWFRLSADDTPELIRNIGVDYEAKIIQPAIRTAIRDIAVNFVATDIYSSKRDDYVNDVARKLENSFEGRGIILEKVLLRNVELPQKVREAIDEKISAEQRAQQMVYVLQKERQEAERKTVEATGVAEAQRIINSTISNSYLQWKYIETLKELVNSPNNSFVIAPYDQKLMPMLNFNQGK
ncbi:MAG TPA: SPFH domain-containing protein [Ignavibacteria bacterium]|nr:SPFH domain-containing protein [Ignavibacteria bacterium]HQY53024.1 SPFH domain-containing protein [Ignavibacteria bacterium]HRB00936.1 SPFH domain-containing protein [Ignavibacteria bacterium]